ncbi:MAG: hypothetical protein ACOYM0_01360 [Bacteroidales bacterium]
MLSLKIEGKNVDLPADFQVTLNLKSPIFEDVGSYTYPFKLPNSRRNAILFGFRHKVANTADIHHEFPASFYWNGNVFFSGTAKMKLMATNSFEGYMLEGNGNFNYQRKKIDLRNIDFGSINFETEYLRLAYINSCAKKAYPESIVAFPEILNKSYFDELPADIGLHYLNYYYSSVISITTLEYNRTVIVPMLYLRYVLDKIFQHLKLLFIDSFFAADAAYNALTLFNLVDCNCGEAGFFGYSTNQLLLNYHVPRMGLNDFFVGLENMFNLRFFVNNNTNTVRLLSVDSILKTNDYIEFSDKLISLTIEPEDRITGFHLMMNMQTDDETYTIQEPYQEWVIKSIKPPVETIAELEPWPAATVFDTRFVFAKDEYYILTSSKVWEPIQQMYYTWNLFSQWIYKNKDRTIETSFSSLMSENVNPYNAIIGNKRDEWEDVTPKLFFVRYQDEGAANSRVSGRCFVAPQVVPTHNLFYGGENGLMNKHYKAYCDFRMSTKLVKVTKHMQYSELKDFDFSKKYMINGIKYLVKSIQVTIKIDRVMPAILEMYVCN